MASIDSVIHRDIRTDGTNVSVSSGSAPVVPSLPNTSAALGVASRLNENMRKTFDRFMTALEYWSELRNYYEGPDQETVYSAFNQRLERISALKLAGEALYDAYAIFDSEISSDVQNRRLDYVGWSPGHVSDSAPYEPYLGKYCRNEYGTGYVALDAMGLEDEDERAATAERLVTLKDARIVRKDEIGTLVIDINSHRGTLASSLTGVDMHQLTQVRFETRNEATTTVQSVEDVEEMIREAAALESLDLQDGDVERIAAEVWANREEFQSGHFTDEQGREWVMSPEGTMVRSGSAVDPRLNATLMKALADDDWVGQKQIDYPGMSDRESITVEALVYGLNKGNSAFTDWGVAQFEGEAANQLGLKVNTGIIGAGLTVLSLGAGAAQYKTGQSMLYPLMSTTDLEEREQRALMVEAARTGGSVVLGSGLMFVAVAAGAPTGGVGGLVVAAVVDQVTGAIVGYIVDTVNEGQTSATQDDINQMTDEELANQ